MADGIDVSEWQGVIDWRRVQTDFAILRAGYGRLASQTDGRFSANYEGCGLNGIPAGAYWYSYAESVAEAHLEAQACLDVIRGRRFEYPVYYDVEEQRTLALGRETVSEIVRAFLGDLEQAGYFAGLYMSADILAEYTEQDIRQRYALWVADYSAEPENAGMWQRSATGRIDGINGNVDLDTACEDYPDIIRRAGLNGFSSAHTISVILDGVTIIDNYLF